MPLQQLVKRIGEIEIVQMLNTQEELRNNLLVDQLLHCHQNSPVLPGILGFQYKTLIITYIIHFTEIDRSRQELSISARFI
jgi:hypothetical protein